MAAILGGEEVAAYTQSSLSEQPPLHWALNLSQASEQLPPATPLSRRLHLPLPLSSSIDTLFQRPCKSPSPRPFHPDDFQQLWTLKTQDSGKRISLLLGGLCCPCANLPSALPNTILSCENINKNKNFTLPTPAKVSFAAYFLFRLVHFHLSL